MADSGVIFGDPTAGLALGNPDTQVGLGVPLGQTVNLGFLCPSKIDCPGSDNPITNYSSENVPPFNPPRVRGFFKDGYCCDGSYVSFTSFTSEDDAIDGLNRLLQQCQTCPPTAISTYSCTAQCQNGGKTVVGTSNLSQADACARAQTLAAADVCPPTPPVTEFCNAQQSCSVPCPDGTSFTFVIPACTVIRGSQQEADFIAFNLACSRAQKYKFCLGDIPRCTCVGSAYSGVLKPVIGGIAPISFTLLGSLPPGLTFTNDDPDTHSATISGTPTTAGTYNFSIEGVDFQGNTIIKQFAIVVLQITTTTLPDYTIGTPYSAQLTATGGSGNYAWKITAGNLPDGLSMSLTGLISGTPTAANGTPLTFVVIDQNCDALDKSFFPPKVALSTTANVVIATYRGYAGYPSFSTNPPTLFKTLTWSGFSQFLYLFGPHGAQPEGNLWQTMRWDYNGSGSIDLFGNKISSYTKIKSQSYAPNPLQSVGNFAGDSINDFVPGYLSLTPYATAFTPTSYTHAQSTGSVTLWSADPNDPSQYLDGLPRSISSAPNPPDYDYRLDASFAYQADLSDPYTDADALSVAQRYTSNSSTAANLPRTTGFVSSFVSVNYVLHCSDLIVGQQYSVEVDIWDITSNTHNPTTYLFTASAATQNIPDSIPTPLAGHQVMVRNPQIFFA